MSYKGTERDPETVVDVLREIVAELKAIRASSEGIEASLVNMSGVCRPEVAALALEMRAAKRQADAQAYAAKVNFTLSARETRPDPKPAITTHIPELPG